MMGIKWETVKGYLKEIGIKNDTPHEDDMDRPSTTFLFGDKWHNIRCRVILEERNEEGSYEFLHVRLFELVPHSELKSSMQYPEYAADVAKLMLGWNFKRKIGSWAVDTENNDGDHYLAAVFPIEDGDLTEKQFARIFISLYKTATDAQDELRKACGLKPLVPPTVEM